MNQYVIKYKEDVFLICANSRMEAKRLGEQALKSAGINIERRNEGTIKVTLVLEGWDPADGGTG